MADALGVDTINIIDAYAGSIIVVFEVSSDEISLNEIVNKFANGEVQLSYKIITAVSSSPDESISIVKDGKLTYAAQIRAEQEKEE